ncbi:hypothetical protein NDU88_000474 [Pleurodeles waltl]|uniref:Uncharacterized protein n=1 Tax=Pleurodeles waltl TaxID=8319 RepID=A0AAV7S897_PLEWA|nr:hypothetical protein NDU88_000474 [Pleurodeles waltl]
MMHQAIATSWEALELKIDMIATDLSVLKDRLSFRVTTTLNDITPDSRHLQTRLAKMESKMKSLEARAEDMENRARKSNMLIVGLLEKTEGNAVNMTAFLDYWIRIDIAPEGLSSFFAFQRADRVSS